MDSDWKDESELPIDEGRGVWGNFHLLLSPLCKVDLLPPGLPLPGVKTSVCRRRVNGLPERREEERERERKRNREQTPTEMKR